jgi:hypothetical protein
MTFFAGKATVAAVQAAVTRRHRDCRTRRTVWPDR